MSSPSSIEKVWGTTAPTVTPTSATTAFFAPKSPLPIVHTTTSNTATTSQQKTGHNLEPLPRAPENVFLLRDSQVRKEKDLPLSPLLFHFCCAPLWGERVVLYCLTN